MIAGLSRCPLFQSCLGMSSPIDGRNGDIYGYTPLPR